jgi:ABC-type phosphate transport system substrate-binding protein
MQKKIKINNSTIIYFSLAILNKNLTKLNALSNERQNIFIKNMINFVCLL